MLTYWSFLILTVAVELLVTCLSPMFNDGSQDKRDFLQVVLGINLITHPFAWAAYVVFMANWAVVESIVVLVETFALRSLLGRNLRSSAGLSVVMNGVSMATGIVAAACFLQRNG